jgi:hypothetical protein
MLAVYRFSATRSQACRRVIEYVKREASLLVRSIDRSINQSINQSLNQVLTQYTTMATQQHAMLHHVRDVMIVVLPLQVALKVRTD